MPAPRFGAQQRRRARQLYDDGHGCNAIAKQLGLAPSTVSKWAAENQLPFDRRQTAIAVRAHVIDLRESALLLAQKLMVVSQETLDSLDGPYTLRQLGTGAGEFAGSEFIELVVDDAPIEVRRNAVVIAGIALDKALKVSTALDEGADLPAVDAWLAHMTGSDLDEDE